MILTPEENRRTVLISLGFSESFIKSIGEIEALDYLLSYPENAYFYLPDISHYNVIKGYQITPIFDQDTFFIVHRKGENVNDIVQFSLEEDSIYLNYGMNLDLLKMDVLFTYYDFNSDVELSREEFTEAGFSIEFLYSNELFDLLDIPIEEYNKKYEEMELWKIEIAHSLGIMS